MIVKAGDTHEVKWRANMDLSDADVRIIVQQRGSDPIVLDAEVTDPAEGEVTHTLTGDLAVGSYRVELEVTIGTEVVTFPNDGYASLRVRADLD